jgi:hypothetical protein
MRNFHDDYLRWNPVKAAFEIPVPFGKTLLLQFQNLLLVVENLLLISFVVTFASSFFMIRWGGGGGQKKKKIN